MSILLIDWHRSHPQERHPVNIAREPASATLLAG
jgi:hypothetical protein